MRTGRFLFLLVTTVATAAVVVLPTRVEARTVVPTRAAEVHGAVDRTLTVTLPFPAGHLALHWAGHPDALVWLSTAAGDGPWGPEREAGRDEAGEARGDGETYGSLHRAGGATRVQVRSDRPLGRLTVLALADDDPVVERVRVPARPAGAAVAMPPIVPRAGWGADESLRFRGKRETWPPEFHPVQKLIVHHTATQNDDPDPRATIRSMYYYHAVTQRWGDIGYNFLIDETGTVYKGRHSHTTTKTSPTANDDTLTGEDAAGRGVTGAHAGGYNSGTVGVALLGTLTAVEPRPAARQALIDVLAWKADRHGLDPQGAAPYTNPVNGTQATFPNIAGHRDVNATECPGDTFYGLLPEVRAAVAAALTAG